MGWGNIYKRRLKVFTVALIIYLDYKALQKKEKWFGKEKRAALWENAHERNAKRLLNLIMELEGLWVKLGQYLSTRADVLPHAYISSLKQLQDSLPPRPLREVRRTIEKELRKSMGDLFSDFVETPLATASIAQVHRATLKDGCQVVVKVQHEGIKEVILEDLKNAKAIVDWIAWAEPQYDFNPMMDEWCKEAPKELDFNHEAENTRVVSKNLCCNRKKDAAALDGSVDVLIPEVIQSSEKVLILEYMDGIRLNDLEALEAHGIDKQKLVEEITRAYAHQIYIDGFFNGDPHPGNFLVSKDPPHRPILLDFGLTKSISMPMKQALAKMFLACAEGDQVALLSAFTEMGLKLRLDMPDQAMEVTNIFFRESTPAKEAFETVKSMANQRDKSMKAIQKKMKLSEKEVKRFNPVDAFPGDAVIFIRVLNLLRGLSSVLDVRVVYLDVMRPFAESALHGNIASGSAMSIEWIYETPVQSDVEAKLRQLLREIGNEKILGIQVCAYKDGKVLIDTACGKLGIYDPRPVKPDSLFPVFSATKGITAGMLHWLVDNGKLKLEDNIAKIWPDFGNNGKDLIKVHHVLNHTSGLHHALSEMMSENPLAMCDWEECLKHIAVSSPQTEPGHEQIYHYLSFGWLCGAIVEHSSGKKFQEVLEEAIVQPLNIDGELYIGIPPGVESRLAALTIDKDDLDKLSVVANMQQNLPSVFQSSNIAEMVMGLPVIFNTLPVRRAIIPAANGHCSARALARYYATLANGGIIPEPHSRSYQPPLGSHLHFPRVTSTKSRRKKRFSSKDEKTPTTNRAVNKNIKEKNIDDGGNNEIDIIFENGEHSANNCPNNNFSDINVKDGRIFRNPDIHDAFLGVGNYQNFALPNGLFGLGFRRLRSSDGTLIGFGHSGVGGSTGFCDIKHRFAIAVTLNKMSLGGVTRSIMQLICSELNVPLPDEFSKDGMSGPDMQLTLGGL